jgi:nitric oxide reductase NorD protein
MLASKTSGAVIELLLATAPTAANRLGDAALFLKYLQFINTLIAQAPRGVRPMLDKLEVLFQNLTLGGLRRWALWGAHAHRTNYEEQIRYFSLESKESLAMMQKERKGTLLVDVQRRINMYLRALWARDFFMRPTSGDFETARAIGRISRITCCICRMRSMISCSIPIPTPTLPDGERAPSPSGGRRG